MLLYEIIFMISLGTLFPPVLTNFSDSFDNIFYRHLLQVKCLFK